MKSLLKFIPCFSTLISWNKYDGVAIFTITMFSNGLKKIFNCLPILSILILATAIRSYEIASPIGKPWESGWMDILGRNHYILGFAQTQFLPVLSTYHGELIFYIHHPPLFPVLVGLSYYIFGLYEYSARLVPIFFSVLTIFFLYLLIRDLFNKEIAIICSFLLAVIPLSGYFGRIVSNEVQCVFFIVLTIWAVFQWEKSQNRIFQYILFFSLTCGILTDWQFLFLLPWLVLYLIFIKHDYFTSIIIGTISFFLIFILLYIMSIHDGYSYMNIGVVSQYSDRSRIFDFLTDLNFYQLVWCRVYRFITPIPIFLFLLGIYASLTSVIKKAISMTDEKILIPCLFLGQNLMYFLLFPQAFFIHDTELYYFSPLICILAAVGLSWLIKYSWDLINKGEKRKVVLPKPSRQLGNNHPSSLSRASNSFLIFKYLVVIFLLIIISIQSFQILCDQHARMDYRDEEVGIFINLITNPLDEIAFVDLCHPVMYYSNRSFVWMTLDSVKTSNLKDIQMVVYANFSNSDMHGSSQGLEGYLTNNSYVIIPSEKFILAINSSLYNEKLPIIKEQEWRLKTTYP